ncbi:MAG TPA: PorV/PorQ family protein, partial [Candidatus Udaeobacter sp.]|nr:PorV/PorQ family protein [Candidatus Udaeobacter sp.]
MPFPTPRRRFPRVRWGLASALLLAAAPLRAEDNAGLVSLELPVGTRASGMGTAFVSVADDPTAMFWNPAGLARLSVPEKHWDILFQHNEWLDDFRQEYVAGATRIGRHAFGGSFSGFYINDLDGRDENGLPTVNFGAYDAVTTGSYAFKINEQAAVGGSLKYIVTNIDDITHFAFAGDLGAQVEVAPKVHVGGAVTNLGSGVTFVTEQDDLPTAVQLGGSYVLPYDLANGSILVALDYRKARGDDSHVLFGAEYDHAGI